jgi:hypothetical protein
MIDKTHAKCKRFPKNVFERLFPAPPGNDYNDVLEKAKKIFRNMKK